MGPVTRYTFRRNNANIIKISFLILAHALTFLRAGTPTKCITCAWTSEAPYENMTCAVIDDVVRAPEAECKDMETPYCQTVITFVNGKCYCNHLLSTPTPHSFMNTVSMQCTKSKHANTFGFFDQTKCINFLKIFSVFLGRNYLFHFLCLQI